MFDRNSLYQTNVTSPDFVLDTRKGESVVDVYDSTSYSLVPVKFVRGEGGKVSLAYAPVGPVYVKYAKD